MQLLVLINFTAAIQGIFLSYILINRKGESLEYRYLAFLVMVMSLALLGPVLGLSGYYREFPHLMRISEPMALLFGPLLFFYISLLTSGKVPRLQYLHFIPFLLYVVSLIPFYSMAGEEKLQFVEEQLKRNDPNIWLHTIRIVYISTYIFICLLALKKFEKKLKINFSDLEKFKLDKSSFLLKLYLFAMVIGFAMIAVNYIKPLNFLLINNITGLAVSILIYGLAYTSWDHPVLIYSKMVDPEVEIPQVKFESPDEEAKPEKSRAFLNLSDEMFYKLSGRIEVLLYEKKVFLDPQISLAHLSEELRIQPYQTSELISRKYGLPFFDLINQHRVEEVKRRLKEKKFEHYSILAISMECGFNSKSSFNTAFRKFTGTTPSEFRNSAVS